MQRIDAVLAALKVRPVEAITARGGELAAILAVLLLRSAERLVHAAHRVAAYDVHLAPGRVRVRTLPRHARTHRDREPRLLAAAEVDGAHEHAMCATAHEARRRLHQALRCVRLTPEGIDLGRPACALRALFALQADRFRALLAEEEGAGAARLAVHGSPPAREGALVSEQLEVAVHDEHRHHGVARGALPQRVWRAPQPVAHRLSPTELAQQLAHRVRLKLARPA